MLPPTTPEAKKKNSTPSFHAKASPGRLGSAHGSVFVPVRASSLRTASSHHNIASQTIQPLARKASKLIHGYMVCGLSRDPNDWNFAPQISSTKAQRAHGSIGSFISPTILGSVPPHDQDARTAQMFSSAMKVGRL